MKFGKFEISEYIVGSLCIILLLSIVLHFTIEERKVKERTKQLELEKEIILLEIEREN